MKAPVKKGDVLGTLIVKKDGAVIAKSPLVAKEQVEEANMWELFKRMFSSFSRTS
ncbi:D-alanyl-D-alanine carboxypeptidase DacF precursor [Anoxybacillus sp. BCO1]|nr:D-alanyl-D-alanine carboxypeptidase DacF precursor [Anoxybacillus sp. BCO1]